MPNGSSIDLCGAKQYARVPAWPVEGKYLRSYEFFTVMAEACKAELDGPDLAMRFKLFAEEMLPPKERKEQRRARRNDLIRDLADKFYPVTLGCNAKARIIAGDLAQMHLAMEEGRSVWSAAKFSAARNHRPQ